MPTTALRLTDTVSPSSIGPLRRETARLIAEAGVDEVLVAAIRLCISETLANVTMHAYPAQSGVVEISVELDPDDVVVTVRDEGLGLGGSGSHRGHEGGLGLELIGKLTDGFRVTSESGRGTEVEMLFSRDAATSSAARLMSL